jgi:hypothetical protein
MNIQPPIRKSKYYFCKIVDEHKKQISIKIPYASILHIVALSNQQGYQVELNLAEDQSAIHIIKEIENTCIETLIKNNKKWFRNVLDESKILSMFDSTLVQDRMHCYISLLRSQLKIQNVTDIPQWIKAIKDKLPKTIYIKLICDGLFIYPKRFGLRWIVDSIQEFQEDIHEISPDYDDIIQYWQSCVDHSKKKMKHTIESMDQLMALIRTKEFSEKEIQELKALL